MKPSVPQTTFSKAQTAKANYSQPVGVGAVSSVAGAKALTLEQVAARLAAVEQQVNDLLQRVYEDGAGNIHIVTGGNISLHGKEILIEGNNKASISVGLGAAVDLNSAGDATITAIGKASLSAAAQIVISGAMVKMNSAFVEASGVFKANTVQATLVTASTYTPGAGNIW
jgi:hypothetical protein